MLIYARANRKPILQYVLLLCCVWAAMLPAQIQARGTIQPAFIEPQVGETYYARYNFKHERGKHNTTNYWRGDMIPINSKLKLLSINRKRMDLELGDGSKVIFVNVQKYTKRNLNTIAAELLSPKPVPIGQLDDAVEDALVAGELLLGMTKGQVIMTRGYPPRHKTPTLDRDTWVYWSSKFVKHTLKFKKGVLVEGRGL